MSNLIGKAYNPYGMASNGNGLISGYEYGRNLAKQRGLASGLSNYLNATDDAGRAEALKNWASVDPEGAMGFYTAQQKLKQAQAERKFNTTNEIKNYEYVKGLGLSDEDAQKYGFIKSSSDPVSLFLQKEEAKQQIADKKERDSALKEYERLSDTYNRLFDKGGLMEKASLGYGNEDTPAMRLFGYAERQTPTQLLNNEVQTARQEIMNVLGQLRLDQMQYLKGAISDKEQQMLADFVSGDIAKYSPAQIKGTFNSLMNKLQSKFGQTTKQEAQNQITAEQAKQELIRRGVIQ